MTYTMWNKSSSSGAPWDHQSGKMFDWVFLAYSCKKSQFGFLLTFQKFLRVSDEIFVAFLSFLHHDFTRVSSRNVN